jgi:hypothetical protein
MLILIELADNQDQGFVYFKEEPHYTKQSETSGVSPKI